MKLVKMFCLAALTALLAMAFLGSSSATASGLTGLCLSEGEEDRCTIPHIHDVGTSVFLSDLVTAECIVLFLGDLTAKGLEELKPLVIEGSYSYSSCETETGTQCVVTELNGPTLVKMLRTGHETAVVEGEGEALLRCGFFIHCVFSSSGTQGTAKGALLSNQENGEVSIEGEELQKVSGFCPETAELDLLTAPLEPTYIVNAADILLGFCLPVGSVGLYKSFTCSQASDDPAHKSSWEFFSI